MTPEARKKRDEFWHEADGSNEREIFNSGFDAGYETARAEAEELVMALEKIRDKGTCLSSNPEECCHYLSKAALAKWRGER